jgi:hypothetical protein
MPKRADIKSILIIGLGFVGTSAYASIPTGRYFGGWHVVSINSLDGTSDDDASAVVVQERNCGADGSGCDALRVQWVQGDNVRVSVEINGCVGENNDFEQSYSVPIPRWTKAGRDMERRIESDFQSWLGQAALMCDKPKRATAFDLRQLRPAVRDFT